MVEISDRREVRVSVGDKEFAFVAEPEAGRLTIREEFPDQKGSGKAVCSLTVSDQEELQAFMQGLSRVMGSEPLPATPPEPSRQRSGGRSGSRAASNPPSTSTALNDPEAVERARSRNPNAFKPWTREEDRRLREGAQEGRTVEELASELQRSVRAVTMRLERLGARGT
ncbi:MAG TPA: hypothetical protein VE007_03230 [Thermoanaerobaculia bacterium]|nr:hypothetical protein [Thermoanaerobaculia bacterium]